MKISIMSRAEAIDFSHHLEQNTAIISITDASSKDVVFGKSEKLISVLRLKFDDVTGINDANRMTSDDAKKIIEFIKGLDKRVELLVVHCQVGISRSSAVAAVISKHINGTDRWVFESNKYRPNIYCYKLLSEEFKDLQ